MKRFWFARIGLLFVSLGLLGTLQAQTPEAVLKAAEERFKTLTTYAATMGFTMGTHHDVGKVYYRGAQYHLDFPEDRTICDGDTTVNWSKEFADISYPVTGDGPDLSAAGIYTLHRFPFRFEWADSNSVVRHMRLTPQAGNPALPTVRIGINRQTGLIEDYNLRFNAALTIDMKVMDMQLNPVLDDSLFIIDWEFVRKVERGEVPPVEHEH